MKQTTRFLLMVAGWFFIALGVLGIFLPLLPTTVFILLAAYCFSRSSEHFHNWMLEHKHFGEILRTYQSGLGMPRKLRRRVLCLLWLSMGISMWVVGQWWAVLLLSVIGLGVSGYLLHLPVFEGEPFEDENIDGDP